MTSPGPFSVHPADHQIIRCSQDGPIAITTVPLAARNSEQGKPYARRNARRIVRALNRYEDLDRLLRSLVACVKLGHEETIQRAIIEAEKYLEECNRECPTD